ncbi:hypothetical protein D187_009904 [Cystobacter fuscus DSM 2262]|uniref:Uncharacterized protein n=1 Tax=Cystobacter fuscus (strain ATCC 25194 / DSM 2262 / NBRC 100088 / M29) TaxID=1242864 RepID=S9PG01_CYSF2|nr:hypothetical protein D187_009904 [Cystobacter fuscus DSM 2262]
MAAAFFAAGAADFFFAGAFFPALDASVAFATNFAAAFATRLDALLRTPPDFADLTFFAAGVAFLAPDLGLAIDAVSLNSRVISTGWHT